MFQIAPPPPKKKKLTHAEGIDTKMFLTHATYLKIMTDLQSAILRYAR